MKVSIVSSINALEYRVYANKMYDLISARKFVF